MFQRATRGSHRLRAAAAAVTSAKVQIVNEADEHERRSQVIPDPPPGTPPEVPPEPGRPAPIIEPPTPIPVLRPEPPPPPIDDPPPAERNSAKDTVPPKRIRPPRSDRSPPH